MGWNIYFPTNRENGKAFIQHTNSRWCFSSISRISREVFFVTEFAEYKMMAAFVIHGLNNLQAKPLPLLLLGVIAPMQRNHYGRRRMSHGRNCGEGCCACRKIEDCRESHCQEQNDSCSCCSFCHHDDCSFPILLQWQYSSWL